MKPRIVPSAILAFALAASPGAMAAQQHEVSLDSLEQAVQIEQAVGALLSDFKISGFGVGSFDFRSGTNQNTFGATKLALSVFKRSGPYFSFFAQFTTLFELEGPGGAEPMLDGEPADGAADEGPPLETEIDNLILSFTPPGLPELTLWLGRFDSPLGFERDDEPLNLQPTTSFNFAFARPVKFTGFLANYTPIPELSVQGFVVNGWDNTLDVNDGKTVGARVSFLPHEYAVVSVSGLYGPEKADNTDDQRFLFNADFTVQPVRKLILGGEFNYGTEENSAVGGGDADWIGGVGTAFLRLARNVGLTLRYDIFDDKDGGRTGEPRTLQSFTVAPMVFFRTAVSGIFSTVPGTSFSLPELALRAGFRRNRSTNPFFAGEGELTRYETQVVIEGVFIY